MGNSGPVEPLPLGSGIGVEERQDVDDGGEDPLCIRRREGSILSWRGEERMADPSSGKDGMGSESRRPAWMTDDVRVTLNMDGDDIQLWTRSSEPPSRIGLLLASLCDMSPWYQITLVSENPVTKEEVRMVVD